jgi:hypothetical protein
VRELAIVGARRLAGESPSEERRGELLEALAANFERPETAPWDWETLRHGKADAWPVD